MSTRLLPLRSVIDRTSLSRTSIYRLMARADGSFPKSVPLGGRVAWIEAEVSEWIDARVAERVA